MTADLDLIRRAANQMREDDDERWHLVADWLDSSASDLWAWGPLCSCGTGCDACDDSEWEPHARHALAVARAFLKEDADV